MSLTFMMPGAIRYSAKKMAKPISFFLAAPKVKSVCLTGDFNDSRNVL